MQIEENQPSWLNELQTEMKEVTYKLCRPVVERLECHSLEVIDDFYAEVPDGVLYYLKSGSLNVEVDGAPAYYVEPGDLFGFHSLSNLPAPTVRAEGPLEYYSLSKLDVSVLQQSAQWPQYLLLRAQFYRCCCTQSREPTEQPHTGFAQYEEGELIIQEGELAEEVYDMLTGSADVLVNGEKVGEINEHEIFGAMAALTHSSRTATVVANTHCMVMVVPGDQFIDLVKSQPRTSMALFENMAHKILDLNKRLVDAHHLNEGLITE